MRSVAVAAGVAEGVLVVPVALEGDKEAASLPFRVTRKETRWWLSVRRSRMAVRGKRKRSSVELGVEKERMTGGGPGVGGGGG